MKFNVEQLTTPARSFRWTLTFLPNFLTANLRVLPDFIVIGAQRSGTTSLYNYLLKHPCVLPILRKEPHFFDINFHRGIHWYRAYFPLHWQKQRLQARLVQNVLSGEASPYYVFHPRVPERLYNTLPAIKLIALLRNPVDRAYSHFQHEVRRGRETLSFSEAIAKEKSRLGGEEKRLLREEAYYSYNHHRFSYVARGVYMDQLDKWFHYFPREQILILNSEDFYRDPASIMAKVFTFLNLSTHELEVYQQYNFAEYPDIEPSLRQWLTEYFRPHNLRLFQFLGMDFGWNGRN